MLRNSVGNHHISGMQLCFLLSTRQKCRSTHYCNSKSKSNDRWLQGVTTMASIWTSCLSHSFRNAYRSKADTRSALLTSESCQSSSETESIIYLLRHLNCPRLCSDRSSVGSISSLFSQWCLHSTKPRDARTSLICARMRLAGKLTFKSDHQELGLRGRTTQYPLAASLHPKSVRCYSLSSQPLTDNPQIETKEAHLLDSFVSKNGTVPIGDWIFHVK